MVVIEFGVHNQGSIGIPAINPVPGQNVKFSDPSVNLTTSLLSDSVLPCSRSLFSDCLRPDNHQVGT